MPLSACWVYSLSHQLHVAGHGDSESRWFSSAISIQELPGEASTWPNPMDCYLCPTPNSYVEILALLNGTSALLKVFQRAPSPFFLPCENIRSQPSANWHRALTKTQPCCHPELGLSASRIVRNKVLLLISHQIHGNLLEQTRLTKRCPTWILGPCLGQIGMATWIND